MEKTELMKRYEEKVGRTESSFDTCGVGADTSEYDNFISGFARFAEEEWVKLKAQLTWRPASDKPEHGETVLATYLNRRGKRRRVRAVYIRQYEEEVGYVDDDLCVEYCEEQDEWYLQEGWYELGDNWGDYSSVAIVEGVVDHWLPMPPATEGEDAWTELPLSHVDDDEICGYCRRLE